MALGGGGFVGSVGEPTQAVKAGFAGATTDTGHKGSSGSFGMLRPGVPDVQLQTDFGWRSEQMMAVVSKQLIAILQKITLDPRPDKIVDLGWFF